MNTREAWITWAVTFGPCLIAILLSIWVIFLKQEILELREAVKHIVNREKVMAEIHREAMEDAAAKRGDVI